MTERRDYICKNCHYVMLIGFVGQDANRTVVICSACLSDFPVCPEMGEQLDQSDKPHIIYVQGKKKVEVCSPKGRIKKAQSGFRGGVRDKIAGNLMSIDFEQVRP